jgi:hypothetical protein
MTERPHQAHKTPTVDADLSELFRRVEAIEKMLEPKPELDTGDGRMLFTYPGRLRVGARSTPYEHPTGGELKKLRARLDVPSSDATVFLKAYRNGVEIEPVQEALHLAAGFKVAEWHFDVPWFSPDVDELVLEIAAAGTGAKGLTVRALWQTRRYPGPKT